MDDKKLDKAIALRNAIGELKAIKTTKQDMHGSGPHKFKNLAGISFSFKDHPHGIFVSGPTIDMIDSDLFEKLFVEIDESIAKLEKMYTEI